MKRTIKSWDSMKEEYGIDRDGDIPINSRSWFLRGMKKYCGNTYNFVLFDGWCGTYVIPGESNYDLFTSEMFVDVSSMKQPVKT